MFTAAGRNSCMSKCVIDSHMRCLLESLLVLTELQCFHFVQRVMKYLQGSILAESVSKFELNAKPTLQVVKAVYWKDS